MTHYCYITHQGRVITAGHGLTRPAAIKAAILALPRRYGGIRVCDAKARFFRAIV